MKRSEIADLLTIAAGLERSGWVPDENDVDLWHAMSVEGKWESFAAARRALFVYRTEQPNFPLRPGHISQVLERVRSTASRRFNQDPPYPPRDVDRDDPRAHYEWIRRRGIEAVANAVAAFAQGEAPAPRAIESAA